MRKRTKEKKEKKNKKGTAQSPEVSETYFVEKDLAGASDGAAADEKTSSGKGLKRGVVVTLILLVVELAAAAALFFFVVPKIVSLSDIFAPAFNPAQEQDAVYTRVSDPIETSIDMKRIGASLSSSQIVVIQTPNASSTTGVAYLFERTKDGWACTWRANATVGRGGIQETISEETSATPQGTFKLGPAFGINENPGTVFAYTQVAEHDYWVNDPASVYYNRMVNTGNTTSDWKSAEHLIEATTGYVYALVIQYNTNPVVAGAGSAIFLHCDIGKATEGCVTVPQNALVELMKLLRTDAVIVMGAGDGIYTY